MTTFQEIENMLGEIKHFFGKAEDLELTNEESCFIDSIERQISFGYTLSRKQSEFLKQIWSRISDGHRESYG